MSKIYKGPAKIRKDSPEKERCVILGEYIIKTNGTVREAAARFGISKSTVHKDVTEKLRETDRTLYGEVKKVLVRNKAERHLRGGQATKQKYCAMKKISG